MRTTFSSIGRCQLWISMVGEVSWPKLDVICVWVLGYYSESETRMQPTSEENVITLFTSVSTLCNAWPLIAQNKDTFFYMCFLLVHFIADSDNHRTVSWNKIYDMRHKSPITDFSFFKVLLDSHMIVILWSLQLRTCVALCIYALELSSTFVICHHPFPKSSLFFFFLFLLN